MNEKTRQQMRETHGLVDALVCYIKCSLEGNTAEDKVGCHGQRERTSVVAVVAADVVLVCVCKPSSQRVCVCVQGVENAVCVLRNLSYQLYSELPPSAALRLEGPSRASDTGKGEAIGCFTPKSRKAKNVCRIPTPALPLPLTELHRTTRSTVLPLAHPLQPW